LRIYYTTASHDNSLQFRKRLECVLKEAEFICFHSATELFSALGSRSAECIISECQLSDGDALPLLQRLRETNTTIPFILLYSAGDEATAATFLDYGANACLAMPAEEPSWKILAHTIQQHIEKYELHNTLAKQPSELQEKTELLNTLIQNSPNIICLKDSNCRWLDLSEVGKHTFGLANTDFVGKTGLELADLHPDRASFFRESYEHDLAVWRAEKPIRKEWSYADSKGNIRYYLLTKIPLFDSDGLRKFLVLIAHDITELKISQERLEKVLTLTGTVAWDWDMRTNDCWFNDTFAKMLGHDPAKLEPYTNQTWNQLCHPDDIAICDAALEPCINNEHDQYETRHRFIHSDGSIVWAHTIGFVAERNAEGKATRMLGICRDITEQKLSEQELRQSRDEMASQAAELIEVNQQLEAFASAVSHDLCAPIRHIKGFNQFLDEQLAAENIASAREISDRIAEAVEKLDLMVEAMIKLHRTSKTPVSISSVDITALAQSAVAQLRESTPERKVEVFIQEGLTVEADADLTAIVLNNIIGNSWKYTATCKQPAIRIKETIEMKHRWIEIADNGVGFNQEHSDDIFKPFVRLHAQSEFEGMGIGLATVQRIIKRHNGAIRAISAPGEGTRILLRFA